MFTDVTNYMLELQPHLLTSIDIDNYRINSNIAKIALKAPLTADNFDTVTYLIDYDSTTGYFRCYNVVRSDLQSYAVYMLEVDLWATFIKDCDFSKIHITRCNRRLNQYGIYDDPQNTRGRLNTHAYASSDASWLNPSDAKYAKISELNLVFLLQYNVYQKVFGDDLITKTALFSVNLGDIKTHMDVEKAKQGYDGELDNVTVLDYAINLIGNIYGVAGGTGTLDAQVIQAWVIPSPLLQLTSTGGVVLQQELKTYDQYFNSEIPCYASYIYPSKKYLQFNVIEVDINKPTYFGTINNGLKLKKYTTTDKKQNVVVQAFIGATTIRIIAFQGEEQKDLTNDFAITLTSSASITTSLREFTRVFSGALNAGQSMTRSLQKGDVAGAGLGLAGNIAGMVDMTANTNKAIGNGDAYTIYYRIEQTLPAYLLNPFVVTEFTSTQDVEKHTNLLGATFDYYGISGDALIAFDFESLDMLATGEVEDTYIVASCDIDGVPLQAHTEIGRKLSAGIYYKVLD